jgi:hypothetical protein
MDPRLRTAVLMEAQYLLSDELTELLFKTWFNIRLRRVVERGFENRKSAPVPKGHIRWRFYIYLLAECLVFTR